MSRSVPLERLYRQMARMRRFEEALGRLWEEGRISGELHLGIGEEGIVAGALDHLEEGDALALDHRPTPAMVGLGVDLQAMVLEMLGSEDGLCGGWGGHMHLFAPSRLAASSGIVGAPGPTACGFALAAAHLRPRSVAVAFFGEGAANQGMLLESLNLAVVWGLPVVFVCKDNGWAISSPSGPLTGGRLVRRARAFGMPATRVDGGRVARVWREADRAIERARRGGGPTFLHVTCFRPRGHFEDDPLVRLVRRPTELWNQGPALLRRLLRPGEGFRRRLRGLATVGRLVGRMILEQYIPRVDPLRTTVIALGTERARELDEEARTEVEAAVEAALARVAG